jgi:hypothetical protein
MIRSGMLLAATFRAVRSLSFELNRVELLLAFLAKGG